MAVLIHGPQMAGIIGFESYGGQSVAGVSSNCVCGVVGVVDGNECMYVCTLSRCVGRTFMGVGQLGFSW